MHRSHTCGELTAAHVGQTVTLSGWVANRRDHGGVVFLDLRDRYGFTQVTVEPETAAAMGAAQHFRDEWVVKVTGTVRRRPAGQENPGLPTGEIEVAVASAEELSRSKTPPFPVAEHGDLNEEIRLKHRYLDLRRRKTLRNVELRAKMNKATRDWFSDHGFLEVQTPIFTVSSPEGARDFLIPSRLHKGMFYALPQAPQQYKQLLMVGGVDKYFQIAPCFRDEDPRADRHACEFYQVDVEMSFVERDDVFRIAEGFVRDLVPQIAPEKRFHACCKDAFPRITHHDALSRYGSDKPDLRFGCEFRDFTETFRNSAFSVFKAAVEQGGTVKAFKLEGHPLSRSQIDELTEVARSKGAGGLAYIIYEAEGPRSPILKFFSDAEKAELEAKLSPKPGDMVFFGAGEFDVAVKSLGAVRLALRDKLKLADEKELSFCWITDFPLYSMSDIEEGKLDFEHNPFSMPEGGIAALDNPDKLAIRCGQYDMACNGFEILSGAIRNHSIECLLKAWAVAGYAEEDMKAKFGAMYNAFQYGVPPHGGFAFGFDRLMMILVDEPNIREIYAFPKSGKAQDAMMNAPAYATEKQLRELHLKIRD